MHGAHTSLNSQQAPVFPPVEEKAVQRFSLLTSRRKNLP